MPDLVPIPWQPTLLLTPRTLALLVAASNRLGRRIFLNGSDAAWRSYARQAYLYNGWVKRLPGFNVASSPDPPGQRNHMRGAAFDTLQTDGATQAACRGVGLIRDSAEAWHQNDPNWANMPIIPVNTTTAGGGSTPIGNTNRSESMYLAWTTDGTGWLVTEDGWSGLPSMQIYNLFKRVITSNQAAAQPDTFLRAEVTMMDNILHAIAKTNAAPITLPTFDTAKLADAVVTALNAKGITAKVAPGDPELVKALDAGFVRAMSAYAKAAADSTAAKIAFDPAKLAAAVAESLKATGIVVTPDVNAVQDAVLAAMDRATAAIGKSLIGSQTIR